MNNKPLLTRSSLFIILYLTSSMGSNVFAAEGDDNLRYAKPKGPTISQGYKIEAQLPDPLGTDGKRIIDSKDLLRRALDNQSRDLNLSDETTKITEGLATSGPQNLANLSIEIVNQSLMNDKSVDDLARITAYYEATAKAIESMAILVKKGRDLQLARDSLNESLTTGTMLKQLQDRITSQDEIILAQQKNINVLKSDLENTFKFMGSLKDAIKETNSAFKNTVQQVRSEQSLAMQRAAENALNKDDAQVDNGVPYSVVSTLVITDSNNNISRESVRIRYKENNLELEAEKGFTVGGWTIKQIDSSGIKVENNSGESIKLMAEG